MRIPLSWLEELLELDGISAEEIAERLSLQSVETTVDTFGMDLEGVVFGKVLETRDHPERKDLLVATVRVGENAKVQVVTADRSVKEGDGVLVALPNSRVGERCIAKREFQGVVSEGMLLSAQDLGLEEKSEGVLKVEENLSPGADAGAILGFGEKILELDITPNRGDVLSVRGLARDLSAILGLPKKNVEAEALADRGELTIEIEDGDCRRYRGVILEGVKVKDSPLRIRKRLWQCGMKTINNVVDVTNYILLQEGQPLHAFDLDRLEGGIRVRSAKAGERIVTLDGEERALDEEILVIADEKRPVAIAGVMGGLESAVTSRTTRILLEAAYFNPKRVRKSSKKLGLQTESSYRFERNVDIEGVNRAQDLAVNMIREVAGGEVVAVRDVYPKRYEPRRIFLPMGKFIRYAGESYRNEEVSSILTALEIPHQIKRCGIEVLVPSHRSFDLHRDVDIVEEIMRVKGYESFPSEPLKLPSVGNYWRDEILDIKKFLRSKGLREVINISYEDAELYDLLGLEKPTVEIINPLLPTQKFMRSSLIPSLLRTALFNENHYNYDLALFELGRVFLREGEEERLGILLKGDLRKFPKKAWEPYDLIEIIEGLARIRGREIQLESSAIGFLHPHAQARVLLDGKEIGFVGRLRPDLTARLELRGDPLLCEIRLGPFLGDRIPRYRVLSKFPPVVRDLALLVDKKMSVSKLLNEIKSQLGEKVEEVMVFDLYTGEKVGEGKKSVGVRLVLRSMEGSLSSEEVGSLIQDLIGRLRERLGVEIR